MGYSTIMFYAICSQRVFNSLIGSMDVNFMGNSNATWKEL